MIFSSFFCRAVLPGYTPRRSSAERRPRLRRSDVRLCDRCGAAPEFTQLLSLCSSHLFVVKRRLRHEQHADRLDRRAAPGRKRGLWKTWSPRNVSKCRYCAPMKLSAAAAGKIFFGCFTSSLQVLKSSVPSTDRWTRLEEGPTAAAPLPLTDNDGMYGAAHDRIGHLWVLTFLDMASIFR